MKFSENVIRIKSQMKQLKVKSEPKILISLSIDEFSNSNVEFPLPSNFLLIINFSIHILQSIFTTHISKTFSFVQDPFLSDFRFVVPSWLFSQ